MASSGSSPRWLGALIEELGNTEQFTGEDLLDAFWLAQWVPAAPWALPVVAAAEPVVSAQASVEAVPVKVAPAPTVSAPVQPALPAKPSAPPAATTGEVGIYLRNTQAAAADAMKASPIRLPGAFALPRALEIGRALRPFKQYRASHTRFTLDVDSTIVFFERHRQLIPQLRPEGERWFDIVLVTDDAPAMAVWRRTFSEFERLLSTHGAFRRVRRFTLSECLKSVEAKRDLLRDPERRTLILFLTDGVAPVWNRKDLVGCMRKWAASCPIGIVQMFPPYHWPATTLGRATRDMQAPASGVPNRQLTVSRSWRGGLPADAVAIPITTLDPRTIGQWAKMVMAKQGTWNPAVVLLSGGRTTRKAEDPPSAQRRVENFRKVASPAAFELACYLSTVPLSLPVMRVVMEAMIPRAQLSYLAEVLASGLVRPVESEVGTDPELVQYELDAEVGHLLRAQVRLQEAAQAQEAVQHEVQRFVERLAGRRLPADVFLVPDELGKWNLPKSAEAFLRIKHELAARLRPRVQPLGVLHNVPELPQPFLQRTETQEGLVQRILQESSVFMVTGPGRYVMVATALRDFRVRRGFSGGIYWNTLSLETPHAGRALYVVTSGKPVLSPPEGVTVLWVWDESQSPLENLYVLPTVLRQETDAYFRMLGLDGEQVLQLEKCHEFDLERCHLLGKVIKVFGTKGVLQVAAEYKPAPSVLPPPAIKLRKIVLNSLFPGEAGLIIHAMRRFFSGEPVSDELVEFALDVARLDPTIVKEAFTLAVEMDFCDGSTSSQYPPLKDTGGKWWAMLWDSSVEGAPPVDARVLEYYFQFFDACWEPVRNDRYFFKNLIAHLIRTQDLQRIELVLLDPYWHAYKASHFGFGEILQDCNLISDTSELAPLSRVMRRAQKQLDSLAPEEISALLIAAAETEPESARFTEVVERNLRRGFPQTRAEVSGEPKWILVAGTGSYQLSPQVVKLTDKLGKTLAARNLNLVGGGWHGIDSVVGRAFANAVHASSGLVENRFLQVLPPGRRPDLEVGRTVHTEIEFGENVRRADAVVLIGGLGSTYSLFLEARKQKKPVYPLPTTGGDARRAFDEFLASQGEGEILARRLGLLEVDIGDDSGIDVLLNRLMALIKGAHGEREWADALLSLVLNLLPSTSLTAYPNLGGYLSELAASAGNLEHEFFRLGQKAKPFGAPADVRLRECLPVASIWISFDILRIASLADSNQWDKGRVIHALIPLLFEFCPEEAEWTLAMAARFEPSATATADELVAVADLLHRQYKSVWAERFYRLVLDKANYDQDQASRATARIGLGCIEILRGNIKGAEQMFEQAREMPGGTDPGNLSRLYDGLATVHFMSGEIVRAQTEQEQALKVAGSEPRDRSIALNHLGRIQRTLGDFPAAEKLHQEALDLAAQTGLAEEIVAAIAELGITYRQVDTLQRAEKQQRRALEISEQILDPGLTAQVLNNLAGVLRQRGELTSAEAMNRRALVLYEGIGGRQGNAESFAGIGFVFRVRGNLAEAEKNFRLALEINSEMGRLFGVADNSNELGSIHRVRGEVHDAQRMHESALEINRKANRLPNLADTYNSLGLVNRVRGEVLEAISWYQQALTLNEKMGRQGGIADSLVNLASAFRRQGRLKEAEEYCQRALAINERIDRVPAIARTCTNLGQIVYDRKQMETAEEYFRRALALDERVGRAEGIAENQYQLGRIAAGRGDIGLARGLMSEALEMYRSGGFKPKVATITRELERLGSGSSKGSSSEYL